MAKRQISIQRALGELKILDARIHKASRGEHYTSYTIGGKMKRGNRSVEEFSEYAKATLQSVQDLIKNRREMKAKIIQSNAVTEISIAGKTMTVAEAIEMKTSIELEQDFLRVLTNDLLRTDLTVDNLRSNAERSLANRIEAILGKDAAKNGELASEIDSITAQFSKTNAVELLDPAGIEDFIQKKSQEIQEFINDIDIILLESNVRTMIEVEA